jgi:hypothetical protein
MHYINFKWCQITQEYLNFTKANITTDAEGPLKRKHKQTSDIDPFKLTRIIYSLCSSSIPSTCPSSILCFTLHTSFSVKTLKRINYNS